MTYPIEKGIPLPSKLVNWRCKGKGPKFVKIGRSVRYRLSDLQSYIESL